jgi:hypothetical protein
MVEQFVANERAGVRLLLLRSIFNSERDWCSTVARQSSKLKDSEHVRGSAPNLLSDRITAVHRTVNASGVGSNPTLTAILMHG